MVQAEKIALAKVAKQKELDALKLKNDQEKKTLTAKKTARDKARRLALKEKQNKINTLLSNAEKQLLNGQLENAYTTYQQVLKIDSANTQVKNGTKRIAGQYLAKANTAAISYDFDKANGFVTSVIKIDPTNSKLADTQTKIFELKIEQQTKQAKEKRLAEEAARKTTIEQVSTKELKEKKRRPFGGF